jgi:hypothetical protein
VHEKKKKDCPGIHTSFLFVVVRRMADFFVCEECYLSLATVFVCDGGYY